MIVVQILTNVFFEVLVSSENVVYIQNNCHVAAWLPRYKCVKTSNKTLAMILCRSRIRTSVDIA